MISRLDGEEESQSSDPWQLQGGSFAGTATKPATNPVQRLSRAEGASWGGDLSFRVCSAGCVSGMQGGEAGRFWASELFKNLLSHAVWRQATSLTSLRLTSSSVHCGLDVSKRELEEANGGTPDWIRLPSLVREELQMPRYADSKTRPPASLKLRMPLKRRAPVAAGDIVVSGRCGHFPELYSVSVTPSPCEHTVRPSSRTHWGARTAPLPQKLQLLGEVSAVGVPGPRAVVVVRFIVLLIHVRVISTQTWPPGFDVTPAWCLGLVLSSASF